VAKAYVDQLERASALSADRVSALRQAIQSAETSKLAKKDLAKLKELAMSLESGSTGTRSTADAARLQALEEILKNPAK